MGKLTQSIYVADLLVLAMLAFFIVLGGIDLGESGGLAIAVAVLAAVAGLWAWQRHRFLAGHALSMESRRSRERRGF